MTALDLFETTEQPPTADDKTSSSFSQNPNDASLNNTSVNTSTNSSSHHDETSPLSTSTSDHQQSPTTTTTTAATAAKLSTKKYHLIRYNQEQQHSSYSCKSSQLITTTTTAAAILLSSTSTPPHSPLPPLPLPPPPTTNDATTSCLSKSLMIIDPTPTSTEPTNACDGSRQQKLEVSETPLPPPTDIRFDEPTEPVAKTTTELTVANTATTTTAVAAVPVGGGDEDEAELPIIQTPPQSTASSVSLNFDLSSSSTANVVPTTAAQSMSSTSTVKEPTLSSIEEVVDSTPSPPEAKRQRIETLRAKVHANHDSLKNTFKNSYTRLRQQQTKHIQLYIGEQLRKLLDLTAKASKSATTTIASADGQAPMDLDKSDDGDLEILTSILKSNLGAKASVLEENNRDESAESRSAQELPVKQVTNSVVKSLVDDLKYEITKRAEEKAENRRRRRPRLRNNTGSTSPSVLSTSESEMDEDDSEDDLTVVEMLRPLSFTGNENSSDGRGGHQPTTTATKTSSSSAAAALDKASSKYWTTSRVQLGSEWDRVQAKLKLLNERRRECNEYTAKQDRLVAKYKTSGATAAVTDASDVEDEAEEAIAALEESLQECASSASDQLTPPPPPSGSSRCHYRSSLKSRLFNLSKSDLVTFDDEMLKSIYYTFIYFNKNLFKTTCCCNQQQSAAATAPADAAKPGLVGKKRTTTTTTAAVAKTCIFCHLLRKYESNQAENQARMRSATVAAGNTTTTAKDATRLGQQVPGVLRDQSNNLSVYKEWADVAHINNDHSYCKATSSCGLMTCNTNDVLPPPPPMMSDERTQPAAAYPSSRLLPPKTEPTDGLSAKKRKITGAREFLFGAADDDSLIDQVVNERLNRLFGSGGGGGGACDPATTGSGSGKRSTALFDNNEFYDLRLGQQRLDHDQLYVDAGIEIDPKEIIQIPDLTYEELEFLNNEDDESVSDLLSCESSSRQPYSMAETSDKENVERDDCRVTRCPARQRGGGGVGGGLLMDKNYFVSLLRKNRLLKYQLYQHQLQYRKNETELAQLDGAKKRRKNDLTSSVSAASATPTTTNRFGGGGARMPHVVVRRLSHHHLNFKRNKKSHHHPHHERKLLAASTVGSSSSSSSSSTKMPPARNRSNSSSSFASTETTNPNSPSGGYPLTSSSSSQYVYLNNNQFDKFDIDNIVIPSEMISNCKVLNLAKLQDLPTPKWRELVIEAAVANEMAAAAASQDGGESECVDESAYIRRHEFYELKKRFEFIHKRIEKEKKNRLRHHASSSSHEDNTNATVAGADAGACTPSTPSGPSELALGEDIIKRTLKVDDHTLDEFRTIVLTLEKDHQHHHQQRTRRSRQSMSEPSQPATSDQDSSLDTHAHHTHEAIMDTTTHCQHQHHPHPAHRSSLEWPRRRFPLTEHECEQLEAENARCIKQDQLGLSYLKLCKLTRQTPTSTPSHHASPVHHSSSSASPAPYNHHHHHHHHHTTSTSTSSSNSSNHKHGVFAETPPPPPRRQSHHHQHHQIYHEGPQANFTGIILLES